ncbi:MAG TPA: histidine kinase, partial [Clostridia bacterium]|nr:histidine kinase [Clostridia bacterium]
FTGTVHAPIYAPEALPDNNAVVVRREYPYVVRVFPIASGENAVLVTQLSKNFWAQIYGQYVPEPDVLCVYDNQGRRIYESEGYAGQPESVWERMQSAAINGEMGNGLGGALLFRRANAAAGLTAVTFIPQSAVSALLGSLKRQLFALMILLLFATAVLSRALSLGITRNIKILQKNAERIGQGRYGDLLPVPAQDEVGELGKTMQAMASRIAQLVEDVNRRETSKREMELEILRAQVSPHFLYNALNTITYLSALQGAENIGRFAAALIDLLQAVLQ